MRKFVLGLGASAVFAVGCVAGTSSLLVPRADAASAERWAYFCFAAGSAEEVHEKANAAGDQGWEMVSGSQSPSGSGNSMVWCFKRPR